MPPAGLPSVKAKADHDAHTIPKDDTVTEGMVDANTFMVLGELDPQALSAVTEIIPFDVDAVAVIELVEELPNHPEGNVQV